MTGYITYLDHAPDDRLLALRKIWQDLPRDGQLPAYDAATLAHFPGMADHASLIEVHREGARRRYFVREDRAQVVLAVGIDSSGTYLDAPSDTPEYQTILQSDYDGIVTSRQPRIYAEEHHLDNRMRRIVGIQLPFAGDGETVDLILEFVFRLEE